jgi:hypothetical protein
MTYKRVRRRLLSALRLLAQPASTQIAQLSRLGLKDGVEELRLKYEDAVAGIHPFIGDELSAEQAERLGALAKYLQAMGARERSLLWSDQALRRAAEWTRVRELAAEALVGLDAWPRSWGKGRRRSIRASANAAKRLLLCVAGLLCYGA